MVNLLKGQKKPKKEKVTAKKLEELWKEVIKAKAGYRSELSGKHGRQIGGKDILHTHHIVGKKSHVLKFMELDNGICLTCGEHMYGIHSHDPVTSLEHHNMIIDHIGEQRYHELLSLRHSTKKVDKHAAKDFLEAKLKEYGGKIK